MKMYVGNLSFSTTDSQLKTIFSDFGTVDSASVISDRETGRSKGFGFVEMNNDDEAKAAMATLDGKALDGRNLKVVAYAKARCEKEKPFEERFFPSRALPFPNLFEPL